MTEQKRLLMRMICYFVHEYLIIKKRKKVQFTENFKKPMKAGMLHTVDGEIFYLFTKNMWIGDSGTLCHITNNDTGLYNVTKINKSIEGSVGSMSATKKGKLCMKVHQVDSTE